MRMTSERGRLCRAYLMSRCRREKRAGRPRSDVTRLTVVTSRRTVVASIDAGRFISRLCHNKSRAGKMHDDFADLIVASADGDLMRIGEDDLARNRVAAVIV